MGLSFISLPQLRKHANNKNFWTLNPQFRDRLFYFPQSSKLASQNCARSRIWRTLLHWRRISNSVSQQSHMGINAWQGFYKFVTKNLFWIPSLLVRLFSSFWSSLWIILISEGMVSKLKHFSKFLIGRRLFSETSTAIEAWEFRNLSQKVFLISNHWKFRGCLLLNPKIGEQGYGRHLKFAAQTDSKRRSNSLQFRNCLKISERNLSPNRIRD